MFNTLIAPSHIGNSERMSRPVPQLLLRRHVHPPVRAEHNIFKDMECQLCVGKKKTRFHSESEGNVTRKMLVGVNIGEHHREICIRGSPILHVKRIYARVSLELSAAAKGW